MRFAGPVFRAHDPTWIWDPLSSQGALLDGGRFNRRGVSALYTSLTSEGALREATPFGRELQPTTICAYRVDTEPLFDATDESVLDSKGVSIQELSCPNWRNEMLSGQIPFTQRFADLLIEDGYVGMLVRSFARGASSRDVNLVLWQYSSELPSRIVLVDDENKIGVLREMFEQGSDND